jgi:hypothetical protein
VNWVEPRRQAFVARSATDYRIAQINHYQMRSVAALALKAKRGVGGVQRSNQEAKYDRDKIKGLNPNREEDKSALFYLDDINTEAERLLIDPLVMKIHTKAMAKFQEFEESYLTFLNLEQLETDQSTTDADALQNKI